MHTYPKDIFEKLEFTKIIHLVQEECQGEDGKKYFENIMFQTDKAAIHTLIEEVDEWKKGIERAIVIPFTQYQNIEEDLFFLSKEGYVLDVESIQKIHVIISIANKINLYFQEATIQKAMPNVARIAMAINIDGRISKEIERVFDEEGNVRPNASEALAKLSKAIKNKEREADKVFQQEVALYKTRGYLTEGNESIRNGRQVLMVSAEHKRQIPGIIHDESATGKTVFIEPEKSIAINNEIHNLYAERRAEIYRIVKDLCNFLRPYTQEIEAAAKHIIKLDTIRAKAKLALRINASKPLIGSKPVMNYKQAFNPILYLKQKGSDQKTIPFDLELLNNNRMLILSGPNAGGKSVTLKTCGLLQLMLQCGMLVTANENSKFGIYESIFTLIGDQQSIEDDLSTYSSHLTHLKKIIDVANDKSLVLIDEFGSGTDPKIGGGIAEAVLKELQHKNSLGVITTHYSNLKFFAYKNQGFVNGSMEFDKNQLKPTYQLIVGRPGSSFAFEIATKTGLPESVIEYARNKAGKHEQSVEDMLVSLQAERQELEQKMVTLMEKEERVDRLMKTYDQLHTELEYRSKKVKLEQKEATLYKSQELQKELQKKIREIQQVKKIEEVKKIIEEKKSETEVIHKEIGSIKTELFQNAVKQSRAIKEGDYVQMRNGNSKGEIINIDNDVAELELGFFKIKVPLKDLVLVERPKETVIQKSSVRADVSGIGNFESKIDIRGYIPEDAMRMLQEFLDKAIINNAYELQIIHGVGNGTMRRRVHQKLKEYKDIKEYFHPEDNLGGEGITYVKL